MNNRINTNVDVYLKDSLLLIRFDLIAHHTINLDPVLKIANLKDFALSYANQSLHQDDYTFDKEQIYTKKIIQHMLQIAPKEPIGQDSLLADMQGNNIEIDKLSFKHIIITYTLSTVPHAFINWFACFSVFINHMYNSLKHIQFNDHDPFEKLNNSSKLNDLFDQPNNNNGCVRKIMTQIIKLNDIKKDELKNYQNALIDFSKIYYYYISKREKQIPLVQCLSDQIRSELLYTNQINSFSKKTVQEKEEDILYLTLKPDNIGIKTEFLYIIELLNTRDRIELIKPCLGMIADDKQAFRMGHTELLLIYFAEFYLFEDGKFGIINLDKNPAYLEFYAEGKMNYEILHRELNHLATCLGWEFEPQIDFHTSKQIVFTDACSQKLAKHGLHINSQFSKDLFNIYKLWSFMTKIRLQGDNVFSRLSPDVFDNILRKTNPSYEKVFYEYLHPTFFKAADLGKAKGLELHNEIQNRKQLSLRK